MAGLAWMKFYVADWVASTMGMTAMARGCYMSLLCHAWDRGSIPADRGAQARICAVSFDNMERAWAELEGRWEPAVEGLTNPKQERVRAEQSSNCERQRRYRERHKGVTSAVTSTVDSGLRAQGSDRGTPFGRTPAASAAPGGSPKKPRRDGKAELRAAVEDWDSKCMAYAGSHLPLSLDLTGAMETYRRRRVANRHPVWDRGQWLSVLKEGLGDSSGLTAAFQKAEQAGWQSVHPKAPAKAEMSDAESLEETRRHARELGLDEGAG